MKTNAIIRIVLFSLAILILLGILLAGMAFSLFMVDTKSGTTASLPPIASDGYSTTSTVSAAGISNLEIDWAAGSITILTDDIEEIHIEELDNSRIKYKYEMVCAQKGDTLKIDYCDDSINWNGISFGADISKHLIITVPTDWICSNLEIDVASATVTVEDVTINEVDFNGASGTCVFTNCTVSVLDVETASGDIEFTGQLDVLECDSASANCTLFLYNTPNLIEMDGASGDLDVTLPDDCGFTCKMDGLSNHFQSDFPTTTSNGSYVYGDGSCRINVSGISGNVTIRKQ